MKKLLLALAIFLLPQAVDAAVFFIDYGCDANADTACGDGTATTTPFSGLDQFAEVARTAGDIAFVRRNQASTTNVTDLVPTSDGTLNNPLTISGDYDNLWNDFATSSQTVTIEWGSKTMTLSASSTIPITAGLAETWIYFGDDCSETYNTTALNNCEYAYEVASSTAGSANTLLTLKMPYKGNQTGAGVSIRIMGRAPQWNVASGDFQFTFQDDFFWYLKGHDLRGTDSACTLNSTSSTRGMGGMDIIIQGDGATDCAFPSSTNGTAGVDLWKKIRTFGQLAHINTSGGATFQDVLIDCNNVANSNAIVIPSGGLGNPRVIDVEVRNCNRFLETVTASRQTGFFRNASSSATELTDMTSSAGAIVIIEDYQTTGNNIEIASNGTSNTNPYLSNSTTSNLRSGGARVNKLVTPPIGTTNLGISTRFFPNSFIKLFDYGFYSDGTSKTYTMNLNSTSTANFTTDPTASELWLECEYYNHATLAHRYVKRSTGVVDFNGSTDWQTISVTCDPAQAGVVYLRAYYGKPKEAASNMFFLDLKIDVL